MGLFGFPENWLRRAGEKALRMNQWFVAWSNGRTELPLSEKGKDWAGYGGTHL